MHGGDAVSNASVGGSRGGAKVQGYDDTASFGVFWFEGEFFTIFGGMEARGSSRWLGAEGGSQGRCLDDVHDDGLHTREVW